MKRILVFLLCVSLIISGCFPVAAFAEEKEDCNNSTVSLISPEDFYSLSDPLLQEYVKDSIYEEAVSSFDSEEYVIDSIQTSYISKEFIEELQYNSKKNIFFGYTQEELNTLFQGKKYCFTLGENGETIVKELDVIEDNTLETITRDVLIGSGVILVCVTVSAVAPMVGAPAAITYVFSLSAKSAAVLAVESAAIGSVISGTVKAIETGDIHEALKSASLGAASGFKSGAIIGAASAGVVQTLGLLYATKTGLTMSEVAILQQQTKWPLEAIRSLHSMEEANVYIKAGLTPIRLSNGELTFVQEINWNLVDSFGRTNIQRVAAKLAPIDETGASYELHHIGMRSDSPLAILTKAQHHAKGDYSVIHYAEEGKDITDAAWASQKQAFWKAIEKLSNGV